jgi:hypothetical protein
MKKLLVFLSLISLVTSFVYAEVAPLVSGQKVQVKKLSRDIANVRNAISKSGPSEFQDSSIVAARQKRFKQFTDALNRYPQLDDPLVKAARAEYMALQKAFSTEFNRAKEQLKKLGDVQARMALLQQNFDKYPVPKPMIPPFDKKAVNLWVKQASAARTVGEHNLKEINAIAPLAYLPNNPGTPRSGSAFDSNDLKSMQLQARQMQQAVQSNYKTMSDNLINQLQQKVDEATTRWQEDPKGEKKWVFLKADQVTQAGLLFSEGKVMAQSSIDLAQVLKQNDSIAKQAMKTLNNAELSYQTNAKVALQSSQLPKPASDDSEMTDIAAQVLKVPRYKFGEFGPIILTTDTIIERESKSSKIEIDDVDVSLSGDIKMSGTETTWTYIWKEFRFAAPIKNADGKWYIWWITAKNYSSGSSITPIGQWIAGKSLQGNPILPSNF